MSKITSIQLFKNIKALVDQSQQELYAVINVTLTETYFHIGRLIVEYEQQGSNRAGYAKETLINLSQKLTPVLGKGFSVDNLENMRKVYIVYKDDYLKHVSRNKKSETVSRKLTNSLKSETVSRKSIASQKSETVSRKLALSPFKLSWSHYTLLTNIENPIERKFYEIESIGENWSLRELKRQFESALFERLALSRNKKKIRELGKKGHVVESAADAIKEDYILEFLAYHTKDIYSENDLEKAIINKLEHFLLELGKGFLFVERQKRIKMDGDDYKIDPRFFSSGIKMFCID